MDLLRMYIYTTTIYDIYDLYMNFTVYIYIYIPSLDTT